MNRNSKQGAAQKAAPPYIRPHRKDHKELSRGAKWVKLWEYDAAVTCFNRYSDTQLRAMLKPMAENEYVTLPINVETSGVLWIAKAILRERGASDE